jgi:hypothetical protein
MKSSAHCARRSFDSGRISSGGDRTGHTPDVRSWAETTTARWSDVFPWISAGYARHVRVHSVLLMGRLLAVLACIVAASPILAGDDALPTWHSFTGYWRMDPAMLDRSPTTPLIVIIRVTDSELTVERRTLDSVSETSRYRLDGRAAPTVQDRRRVESSVALENGRLVVTTRVTLPGGRPATMVETYSVLRKRMTIERATTEGSRTTRTDDLLRRVPEPPRPRTSRRQD